MPKTHSLEAKIQRNRNFTQRLSDDINSTVGTFSFFVFNVLFFLVWFLINTGRIPEIGIFDPYPFNFLTMTVSLEAIFLSIFVLMSQNRQSQIDSLREEIHLQINQIAEKEITKALQLLVDIHKKTVGNTDKDLELQKMLHAIDTNRIEANMEKELLPQPFIISDLLKTPLKKLGLVK